MRFRVGEPLPKAKQKNDQQKPPPSVPPLPNPAPLLTTCPNPPASSSSPSPVPRPQGHVTRDPPPESPLMLANQGPVNAPFPRPVQTTFQPSAGGGTDDLLSAQPGPSSAPREALAPSTSVREVDRESDSGSSLATEAYNSEDEHSVRPVELPASSVSVRGGPSAAPMLTPEQREAAFRAELARRHWEIVVVRADGNCLFRALAHSFWGDEALHAQLRARVMDYVLKERDYFSQFVAEDFPRYVRRKRRDGCHGNHVELQAAADLLGVRIEVYAYSLTPVTVIESWNQQSDDRSEPLRLSFHRGSHYNAIVNSVRPKKMSSRGGRATAAAAAADDAEILAIADALATQEELEQAALEMSIAEARRPRRGSSAASSSTAALRETELCEDQGNTMREASSVLSQGSKREKQRAGPGPSSALPPTPQSSPLPLSYQDVRSRAGPSSAGASGSLRFDSSEEKDEER